jgi:hypothetical protein
VSLCEKNLKKNKLAFLLQSLCLDEPCLREYNKSVNFWFRLPIRTRLGIISFALLAFAIVLLLSWYHDPSHFSYRSVWILRVAPLLFLLWLTWSDLKKILWWHWLIIVIALLVSAIKPGAWLIGIPVIGYILFAGHKK